MRHHGLIEALKDRRLHRRKIILGSGVILEPTQSQFAAVNKFLLHSSNTIVTWDQEQQRQATRQRRRTPDEWVIHHWRTLMRVALELARPVDVNAIDEQVKALEAQKWTAMQLILRVP
jgi:hypothetical protein